MRRLLAPALALAAFLLVPLASAQEPEQLVPGVTWEQHVELTPHGPVAYTVITAPAPTGLTTLRPVLGGGTITGPKQTMTQLEESISGNGIAGGINGDFTGPVNSIPNGIVVVGGALEHTPTPARSSIGFDASGQMHVGRVPFSGTWQGSGQREPIAGVNARPQSGQTILFTPAWGATTPDLPNAATVTLDPFPATDPGADLHASVTAVGMGATAIPPEGAVLVATGGNAPTLQAEAPQDAAVTVRLSLPEPWGSLVSALGGGPVLVRGGKAVYATGESFAPSDLNTRQARAAVGQLANGNVILVAVDGGRPGYSIGMTSYELARTMANLGAVTAAGLSFGRSVAASFAGQLLDRSNSGIRQPRVKEGLVVVYSGVDALPPSVPVLGETDATRGEQLAYRLTRPSTVTATVVAPDGTSSQVDAGSRDPGLYRFPFTSIATEGTWHWHIEATDDLNRASSVDETFVYDATLTDLSVPRDVTGSTGLSVGFALSRPASAALAISAPNGTPVASTEPVQLAAGTQGLQWDGNTSAGTPAPPATYVATVTETDALGTTSYHGSFRLHR